jgi:hypothetical protein
VGGQFAVELGDFAFAGDHLTASFNAQSPKNFSFATPAVTVFAEAGIAVGGGRNPAPRFALSDAGSLKVLGRF